MDAIKAAVVREMKETFQNHNPDMPLGADRRTEGWEITHEDNLSITIKIPQGERPASNYYGPRYFEIKVTERY